ncbi:MAG TPA: membrane protein insertase YidC [Firmicutes bacterium]|nr:membrane protein insertase YidC [Bacillota bacterium]
MQFLSDLMASILEFFYTYLGNWGYAIIGLTFVVRLIIWPLTIKQNRSLKRMQEIQPQQKKLQEKYKNNPEKLNKEMLALYQKHGVNPMGGCLPLLLQFPILIALFRVLQTMEYTGGGVFIRGWINDLSVPDPYYILPVLAAVTTYITQKQVATDPKQAQMMMFMPLLIGWFATRFPAGLALYWVASNIFGIIQHYLAGGQLALKGELAPDENN